MDLSQKRSQRPRQSGQPTKVDPDHLALLVLDKLGRNLEVLVAAEETETVGILRHEGIPYVWSLAWTKEENELDFLLKVWEVRAQMRNGKPRSDRKPKLLEVVVRQFTEEIK